MKYLFTYGTLREGAPASHVLSGFQLCFAQGKDFDFPYVVPYAESLTFGNLVQVPEKDLPTLDYYENVQSGLYERQQHAVYAIGGNNLVPCYVYVAGTVDYGEGSRLVIESGDWYKR